MAMIMPERTVDAWTATYITGRRWRARLWAPTERAPGERYDLGVGLGSLGGGVVPPDPDPWPDKVFVLENKGVDERKPGGTPIVLIRIGQLLMHLAADRSRGGSLVYYVLPDPTWRGRQAAPYGTVPGVAALRTRGPAWPGFQLWAVVAHVEDLLATLGAILVATPARFKRRDTDWTIALDTTELWGIPNRLVLRDFISAVRDCTRGRELPDPNVTGPPPTSAAGPPAIGPSLDDLADALEVERGAVPRDADAEDDHTADDDLAEAFDRAEHTTVYGVGDAEERSED